MKHALDEGALIEMENAQMNCGSFTYYLVWHDHRLKEASLRLLQEWLTGSE